jgi:hypothetical protein
MLINRRIGELRQGPGGHQPGAGRLTATAAFVLMNVRLDEFFIAS